MNIQAHIDRHRLQYIVDSYQLQGEDDPDSFWADLADLLDNYPTPIVELAVVETLVTGWLNVPMVRGCEFLRQVQEQLLLWHNYSIVSTLTVTQFQSITGLSPNPILKNAHAFASKPKAQAPWWYEIDSYKELFCRRTVAAESLFGVCIRAVCKHPVYFV